MKNFYFKKEYTGFTLIELLISTSIFAIVAVGGLSILLSSQRAYKRISNNRVAVDNINMLIDTISREIKFGSNYGCVNNSTEGSFNRVSNTKYNILYDNNIDLYNNILGTCNAIAFTPQSTSSLKVVYYYNIASSTINQVSYQRVGLTSRYNRINSSDMTLTTRGFIVDKFWFKVSGINRPTNDFIQPKIEVYISGVIDIIKGSRGETFSTTTLFLQTSVSQRSIDN